MASPPAPLPLPIATLVRRARNATDPTRKHLAAYYAWEASVRLTVATEPPSDAAALALPSTGHWVRAMPERKGNLADPALVALHVLLAEVGLEQKATPKSTSASKLLGMLPPYRNKVIGHGSTRTDAFNLEAARIFLEAIEPAWRAFVFFPEGASLVLVEKVELAAEGGRRARIVRLEGLASEREGETEVDESILPGRVHLRSGERLVSLYPWVLFEGGEDRERALFFNGYKNTAEYLDYASGDVLKAKALAATHPTLDADFAQIFGTNAGKQPMPSVKPPAPVQVSADEGEGEPEAKAAPAKKEEAPRTTKRSPILGIFAGVVLLALVGTGVWLGTRGPKAPVVSPAASASADVPAVPGQLEIPRVSADPAVQAEFRRGIEALLQTDVFAAETAFLAVREKAPKEPWPRLGLAITAGLQSHFEDSNRELDEAISLTRGAKGRDAELVAIVDAADGDAQRGLSAWGEYRKTYPGFFLGHLTVAYYYMRKGTHQEGLARFDEARAVDSRHALPHFLESLLDMEAGKLPDALVAVGKALELQAASPWLVAQRGMIRLRMGEVAAAQGDFEVAIARRGPFSAHLAYALSLLASGKAEDEAKFERERALLLDTRNVDDRLAFMCVHPLVLLRVGRAKEADVLLPVAVDFAVSKGKQGTVLRCLLMPAFADVVLGRLDKAEEKIGKVARVWEGFGLAKSDETRGKVMVKALKGIIAAEKGDLAGAEAEYAEIKRNSSSGFEELGYSIASAKKEAVAIPDVPDAMGAYIRFRRTHLQGRSFEAQGKLEEAEKAYGKLFTERAKCWNSAFDMNQLCGPYLADGLVRRAELLVKRGADDDARTDLDTFAELWPRPDADLAVVKRAAELRKKLGRGK